MTQAVADTASSHTRQPVVWRVIETPPWSGEDNMAFDAAALDALDREPGLPTLRFFSWNTPTVSYGRLQRLDRSSPLVPPGWALVQRPTGGGMVRHVDGWCFSLAWRHGTPPLPDKVVDQYRWIHQVVYHALSDSLTLPLRLATCADTSVVRRSSEDRDCFTQPVGDDLLHHDQKVLGGAIARRRLASLYQGALQLNLSKEVLGRLKDAFQSALLSS